MFADKDLSYTSYTSPGLGRLPELMKYFMFDNGVLSCPKNFAKLLVKVPSRDDMPTDQVAELSSDAHRKHAYTIIGRNTSAFPYLEFPLQDPCGT